MAKYKIILNYDLALIAEVNRQLQETKGYCPCALEWNEDTRCVCKTFLRILRCCCIKYSSIANDAGLGSCNQDASRQL